MSDDLISRKSLLDKLNVFNDKKNGNEHFIFAIETAKEIIENEPTAFDKEKVIYELKQTAYWKTSEPADGNGCIDDYCDSEVIDLDKAIKIVEKGGIE